MDKKTVAITIVKNSGGMAKTADFVSVGMTSHAVSMLCKEGSIERIRHGFYKFLHSTSEKINDDKLLGAILSQGVSASNLPFFIMATAIMPRINGRLSSPARSRELQLK